MTREEQIAVCRQCTNRKMSDEGLICKLTNAKATFQDECADFELIPALKPIIREEDDGWKGWKDILIQASGKLGLVLIVISYLFYYFLLPTYFGGWISNVRVFAWLVTFHLHSSHLPLLEASTVLLFYLGLLLSIIGVFKPPRKFAIIGIIIACIILLHGIRI